MCRSGWMWQAWLDEQEWQECLDEQESIDKSSRIYNTFCGLGLCWLFVLGPGIQGGPVPSSRCSHVGHITCYRVLYTPEPYFGPGRSCVLQQTFAHLCCQSLATMTALRRLLWTGLHYLIVWGLGLLLLTALGPTKASPVKWRESFPMHHALKLANDKN